MSELITMQNQAMRRKLESGTAVNVCACERTDDGDYILHAFVEDMDYCDSESEQWIWSIGRCKSTGKILAATSAKFYANPGYECLWLR